MFKKNGKILLIIFLILAGTASASFADNLPKIRELPLNTVPLNNRVFGADSDNIFKSKDITRKKETGFKTKGSETTRLEGGITEIKAIMHKSMLMKFDEPIKRVTLANDEIADIVILSPLEILINGKAGGETSLIIWGVKGNPVAFNLLVQDYSISFKQNFLNDVKKIAPYEDINFDFINTGYESITGAESNNENTKASAENQMKVLMTGKLSSTGIQQKIRNLAIHYGYTFLDMTEANTPQVMISVKVVEINKEKLKRKISNYSKGVDSYNLMNDTFGWYATAERPILDKDYNFTGEYEDLEGNYAIQYLAGFLGAGEESVWKQSTFPGTNEGFTFWKWSYNEGGADSQIVQALRVAETEDIASILAEPKLLAVNNQEAMFHSGDQIPIVSGKDEYGGLIIEYRDIGINITFKPTILEESERILLEIKPEITEPDLESSIPLVDGFPVYSFKTRSADTKVELQNNETMVIGGLMQKRLISQKTKVPYIGSIPILGNLLSFLNFLQISDMKIFSIPVFGNLGNLSNNYSNSHEETELMIFVTPTIIKPDNTVNGV